MVDVKSYTRMGKTKQLAEQTFESSSSRTPQYLAFHRTFKREFTNMMQPYCDEILVHKPNHFDVSGFFKLKSGAIWYFSVGDMRWDKSLLYRTAKDFKDYTGGSNNQVDLDRISDLPSLVRAEVVN